MTVRNLNPLEISSRVHTPLKWYGGGTPSPSTPQCCLQGLGVLCSMQSHCRVWSGRVNGPLWSLESWSETALGFILGDFLTQPCGVALRLSFAV